MAMRYNDRTLRQSDSAEVFGYALRQNPLLTSAAGVAVIAGGCTTMGNAVVLSVMMLVLLPLMGLVSAIEVDRIRPERRLAVYCAVSTGLVLVLSLIIDGVVLGSVEALGIYAPLAAVSSLVLARASDDAPILTRREAIYEGLAYAVVFCLTALPVGLIREIAGEGRLFGAWLGFSGSGIFEKPWMGYFLCGAVIAVLRRLTDKPERAERYAAAKGDK